MASAPVLPPNRHIEFKKGGWGAAILTCVATAAVFMTAWYIHERTYRPPTDVMMTQAGGSEPHGAPAAPAGGAKAGGAAQGGH